MAEEERAEKQMQISGCKDLDAYQDQFQLADIGWDELAELNE